MNVLVLGSGGREHALCWKLSQSAAKVFCAPGNPGTEQVATNISLEPTNPSDVLAAVRSHGIDLVVVGPEAPLVAGVADVLSDAGVPVFGPARRAAQIEGSKAFAKDVMASAGVPTARYEVFDSVERAEAYARQRGRVVVKADGLAAGKGVVVARSADEAVSAVRSLSALGAAGQRLVLEEVLEGEEVSVIALCDGEHYALLPPAQDHKRLGDGDTGPNTGGMGAYAPAPFLDARGLSEVGERVIAPTLRELARRGSPFRGALYAGLMLTREGVRVLEFNCRFGDPEAQVLLMQLADDLLPLLFSCAQGRLSPARLKEHPGASVGVVLAAEGYPGAVKTGDEISGLEAAGELAQIFHAGTRRDGGRLVTAGGRVLTVCARGETVESARDRAYEAVSRIRFRGMHFRKDIAARAIR